MGAWRYDGSWLGQPYSLSIGQMNLLHRRYLRMFMERAPAGPAYQPAPNRTSTATSPPARI